MSTVTAWLQPRMRTARWIAAGYTSFAIVFAAVLLVAPRLDPITAPTDRLLLGVQLAALPSGVVICILQGLWRIFDTPDAENPLLGRESQRFKINQRVMTNTIEQFVIFVPMLIALSVRIEPQHTWVLPVLVGMWCVGRFLFWIGYQIESVWRAIGMDWTSSVAMITASWLLWTLL